MIFFSKKNLKVFTEVGKKHSVPVFLFHPLVFVSPKTDFDEVHDQRDSCEVFCENQHIVFGVINSKWLKGQRHSPSALIVSMSLLINKEENLMTICTYKH